MRSLCNELVFYDAWIHIHVYTLIEFPPENDLMGKVEQWKYQAQKRAKYLKLGVKLFKFKYFQDGMYCMLNCNGCYNKNDFLFVMR